MSDQPTTDNDTTTPSESNYRGWPDHGEVVSQAVYADGHSGPLVQQCACGFTPKNQSDPAGAMRVVRRHIKRKRQ